jgi:hypothetical protein
MEPDSQFAEDFNELIKEYKKVSTLEMYEKFLLGTAPTHDEEIDA